MSILVLIGCKKEDPTTPIASVECGTVSRTAYFPNSPGSYWIYEWYNVNDTSGTETALVVADDTTKIIGDTLIGGESYYIWEGYTYHSAIYSRHKRYLKDSLDFVVDSSGNIIQAPDSHLDTIGTNHNPAMQVYYYNDNWYDSITVPAGEFPGYRSLLSHSSPIIYGCASSTNYVSPHYHWGFGVGMLKKEFHYASQSGCSHFEGRLKEYYIAP
jgi:hypothetical protein